MSTATFAGHHVIDQDGQTVGRVTDVFYSDRGHEPQWLIVNPGVFRKERLVPVAGSYSTADGKLKVPFDREWIKGAPAVGGDHFPGRALRQQAAQYFGVEF